MQTVHFWNGNKSPARQDFELALLQACLHVTNQAYSAAHVLVDNTDYPKAEDEGNIFTSGADILVTVAGNVKFENKNKLVISQPLAKGLLGYRLLLIKDQSLAKFAQLQTPQQLQALSIGIPQTWADAELFRHNQYKVIEQGSFDDLFLLLKNGTFDYVALGVNEIEEICKDRVASMGGISIEPTLLLYYPFPLVFYINPSNPALAQRIEQGLKLIISNGDYQTLFSHYHGDVVKRLNLRNRKMFTLTNPVLPAELVGFSASLMD